MNLHTFFCFYCEHMIAVEFVSSMIIRADILLTNTIDELFVNVDDEHSSATELSTNTCTRIYVGNLVLGSHFR
jgi:hypothetical protein